MKTFGFRQCVKIISLLFAETEFLLVKREFNGIIHVQPIRISYKQFLTKNFAAAELDPRQLRFIVHSLYFNVIGAANCKELKVVRMLITVIWEFNPNRFPIVVGLNIADCQ